jgi:hypothetical protein
MTLFTIWFGRLIIAMRGMGHRSWQNLTGPIGENFGVGEENVLYVEKIMVSFDLYNNY